MLRAGLGLDAARGPGSFAECAPARRNRYQIGDPPLALSLADDPRARVDLKRFPRADLEALDAQARDAGFDAPLLVRGEHVHEGTWFHVIARVGARFVTPPQEVVIEGTTRERVLRGLRAAGVEVDEQPVSLAELGRADAVYGLSALIEVAPIGRVGEQSWPAEAHGAGLALLQAAFRG